MSEEKKQALITDAEGLAKLFSVDISIKLFGHTIWEYHFPPKKTD